MKIKSALAVLFVATIGIGANCINPKVIKSVLDITQTACVLVHDWTDDEAWISKKCDIAEEYLPEVRKLISARKQAAKMKSDMQSSGTYGVDKK